jgi:endonuclease-8
MPEGDTLRQAELRIAPLLEGRRLERVWFRRGLVLSPRAGQLVESVHAVGKHLLIELDRGLTLDTHLGMGGWWTTMPRTGAPQPGPKLRIALTVAEGHALCYAAPTIRTYVRDGGPTPVDHLGPDLSDEAPDLDAVLARIDAIATPEQPVADVLLDQRIAAGVGNVFKSEALFVVGIHPLTPIGALDADVRRRLWTTAHRQLRANAKLGPRRTTVTNHGVAVYGRHHGGCPRCDGAIEYAPAGPGGSARSSYWCPVCQPASS